MENSRNKPVLSVVMPVHNAAPFLDESISSILNQSFTDFEFMILDDGSTDDSGKILREWQKRDSRIRLFRSERNLGLSGSSNRAVALATAPLVARMDADDISHRDRLKRQWQVLESHPDVVAVGSLFQGIDSAGRLTRPRDRWRVVRHSPYIPFPHGSVMFRRKAFDQVGGYNEQLPLGEDQDLCYKLTSLGKVVTLPETLYYFRYHLKNTTVVTGGVGVRAITDAQMKNGHDLAALYLVGAMRLWAGQSPATLPELIEKRAWGWNLRSLITVGSAAVGAVSPALLRFLLSSFIRTRDGLAALWVKDGRPYEWRLK